MKLLTAKILKALPPIGATSEMEAKDIKIQLKLFAPLHGFYWYIYEYDPKTEEAYGFVNLADPQCSECGYICLKELKKALGWKLERDMYYTPETLEKVRNQIQGN